LSVDPDFEQIGERAHWPCDNRLPADVDRIAAAAHQGLSFLDGVRTRDVTSVLQHHAPVREGEAGVEFLISDGLGGVSN
jgi:hypothetical protein